MPEQALYCDAFTWWLCASTAYYDRAAAFQRRLAVNGARSRPRDVKALGPPGTQMPRSMWLFKSSNVMRPSGRAFRVPACEPSSVATGLCVLPGRGRLSCCSCPDKQRHIVSRAVKRESPPSSHGNRGGVCGCRAPSDQRHTVTRAVRQETPPSPYGKKRPRFRSGRCVRSGVCIAPTGCLRFSCRSAAPRACARATPSCQLPSPTTVGHLSSEIAHHASRDTQYSDSFLP